MWCLLCCEDMAGRYQCGIRDIVKQVEQEQSLNHSGRFEWVDSILVQCLQDGDWLLIENVNFCRFVCKCVCNSCIWLMQITIGVTIWHYTNDARLQVEHSNMLSRGWHVITRAQPEWWHINRGTTYLNVPRASVLHLFCRVTNYEQVQNPDE